MGILDLLRSLFSSRAKSLARYKSGMFKASKGDYAGAIVDYTATLEAPGLAADVKGMALYNRALAYSAIDEVEKGSADLTEIMKMPGLPEKIKTAASQRQERLRRREV